MTKLDHAAYLQSAHWQKTRKQAIEDQGECCQRCSMPRWLAEIAYDQDLHVHHLTYKNKGEERPEDLEVLCRACHEIETFGRTGLRVVTSSKCLMCNGIHWDRRKDLCAACYFVTGENPDLYFSMNRCNPAFGYESVWLNIIRTFDLMLLQKLIDPREIELASRYLIVSEEGKKAISTIEDPEIF